MWRASHLSQERRAKTFGAGDRREPAQRLCPPALRRANLRASRSGPPTRGNLLVAAAPQRRTRSRTPLESPARGRSVPGGAPGRAPKWKQRREVSKGRVFLLVVVVPVL